MSWPDYLLGLTAGFLLGLLLSGIRNDLHRHADARKNDEAAIRIVFPSQEAMISWLADNIRAMEHKEEA